MPTRILIVEDDPDIAELVARYLDKAGFVTERAATGRDALQTIGARPPELIVLDLMLPHVDGLEVCRVVRGNEATAAVPIIMLTARAEESERIVGLTEPDKSGSVVVPVLATASPKLINRHSPWQTPL